MTCSGTAICSEVPTIRWDKSPTFFLPAFLPCIQPSNPHASFLCLYSLPWEKLKSHRPGFALGFVHKDTQTSMALFTRHINLNGYVPFFTLSSANVKPQSSPAHLNSVMLDFMLVTLVPSHVFLCPGKEETTACLVITPHSPRESG